MYKNRRIVITGGTGSLGKALTQYLLENYEGVELVIFSKDETRQARMKQKYPQITFLLGDVSRLEDLNLAFKGADIVFHCAAYKQVPAAQNNAVATFETNIVGSKNVCVAALTQGVEKVIAPSTDKAAMPTSFYGVSKSSMETFFQDFNKYGGTTYHLARYGNVVGSNASVVPLFIKQAKDGIDLTVTDESMTRFWIPMSRAVDLIITAGENVPGTILVPRAKALSVYRVAEIIRNKYNPEVSIKTTGIRPGEKIHEAMVTYTESFHTVVSDDSFVIYPPKTGSFNESPFSYESHTCPVLSELEFLDMIPYDIR